MYNTRKRNQMSKHQFGFNFSHNFYCQRKQCSKFLLFFNTISFPKFDCVHFICTHSVSFFSGRQHKLKFANWMKKTNYVGKQTTAQQCNEEHVIVNVIKAKLRFLFWTAVTSERKRKGQKLAPKHTHPTRTHQSDWYRICFDIFWTPSSGSSLHILRICVIFEPSNRFAQL